MRPIIRSARVRCDKGGQRNFGIATCGTRMFGLAEAVLAYAIATSWLGWQSRRAARITPCGEFGNCCKQAKTNTEDRKKVLLCAAHNVGLFYSAHKWRVRILGRAARRVRSLSGILCEGSVAVDPSTRR